jgi:hypothetical protein
VFAHGLHVRSHHFGSATPSERELELTESLPICLLPHVKSSARVDSLPHEESPGRVVS